MAHGLAGLSAHFIARFFTTETATGAAVTNAVPRTLARVILGEGVFTTLGTAGADDVFVTAADATTCFNSRLQPTQITRGTQHGESSILRLDYGYGAAGKNNGNVRSQTITAPGLTLSQTFTYDALNRLQTAREMSGATENWKQQYAYDRFGNRTIDTNPAYTTPELVGANPIVSPANNRITPRAGESYHYDAAGNLDRDQTNNSYTYDAENHLVSYNGGAGVNGGTSYSYDGDERRVKKVTPAGVTVFVYNVSGQLVAEYSSEPPPSNGTSYLTADTLGSIRVVTDKRGQVRARHDYLPFGEEVFAGTGGRTQSQGYSQPDGVRFQFTGQERDNETGLDYMKARYYSSTQGRFTSVDPSSKSIIPTNPQTLNRYSYTYNNPLRYVDKNGKWPTEIHNKIIAATFDRLRQRQPDKLRQIQKGSESVDANWQKPVSLATENTLVEGMAPRHAMTPGHMVRQLGSVSAAQNWSRGEATKFINDKMGEAKQINNDNRNKSTVPDAALYTFGQGSHPITDGSSPAHREFQVYNLAPYKALFAINPLLGITTYKNDMDAHSEQEAREPTQDEMNHMTDDLRMQYLNTFGREMYEQAVSPEEREATDRRRNPRR